MPTCTPIYGLPYAIGSDRPCDIGDTFCSFAAEVELELNRLDSVVARTNTAVPMAKVSISTPQALSSLISFDTVDEDTDDMVDLSESPTYIFAQRTGLFRVRSYVEVGTTGSASSSFILQVDAAGPLDNPGTINPAGNPIIQISDPNLANSVSYSMVAFYRVTLIDSRFFASVQAGSVAGTPTTINRAELDVEWMAD
jgi:hypothetical protein